MPPDPQRDWQPLTLVPLDRLFARAPQNHELAPCQKCRRTWAFGKHLVEAATEGSGSLRERRVGRLDHVTEASELLALAGRVRDTFQSPHVRPPKVSPSTRYIIGARIPATHSRCLRGTHFQFVPGDHRH
jgi:hypothetical protein